MVTGIQFDPELLAQVNAVKDAATWASPVPSYPGAEYAATPYQQKQTYKTPQDNASQRDEAADVITAKDIASVMAKIKERYPGLDAAQLAAIEGELSSHVGASKATFDGIENQAMNDAYKAATETQQQQLQNAETAEQRMGRLAQEVAVAKENAHNAFAAADEYTTANEKLREAELRAKIKAAHDAGDEALEHQYTMELTKFYYETGQRIGDRNPNNPAATQAATTVTNASTELEKLEKERHAQKQQLQDKEASVKHNADQVTTKKNSRWDEVDKEEPAVAAKAPTSDVKHNADQVTTKKNSRWDEVDEEPAVAAKAPTSNTVGGHDVTPSSTTKAPDTKMAVVHNVTMNDVEVPPGGKNRSATRSITLNT